ncbi:hypothetical protein BLTE_14030 [Blastochloris tepida]|uniref:Uncharacterized protein n=1 Tax=Blastochloris tepida TaxID=2233851 RepID=A0A348FZI5_9HYPH|nr:hypothetical protein BLTE_14030 [Blastochloris tepida]
MHITPAKRHKPLGRGFPFGASSFGRGRCLAGAVACRDTLLDPVVLDGAQRRAGTALRRKHVVPGKGQRPGTRDRLPEGVRFLRTIPALASLGRDDDAPRMTPARNDERLDNEGACRVTP